jgi:hypothetical protein
MPRLRPRPFLAISLLVAGLVVFSASMLLAQTMTNPKAQPDRTMTWVLTNGTVIDPGKTEGSLTTGYVVEATATAKGPARVSTGKFTIKCNITDQGGGKFRLRGVWNITREGVAPQTHRTPDSINGALMANLDFNPAAGVGAINSEVQVSPKRRHAGKEIKAGGTYTGDEKFNGTISISRK